MGCERLTNEGKKVASPLARHPSRVTRHEYQKGNLNPGGKFIPPMTLAIFSCVVRSTF